MTDQTSSYIFPTLDGMVVGVLILSILVWVGNYFTRPKIPFPLAIASSNIVSIFYSLHLLSWAIWPLFILTTSFCFLTFGNIRKHLPLTIKWYVPITIILVIVSIVLPLFFSNADYRVFLIVLSFWIISQPTTWIINRKKSAGFKVGFWGYLPATLGCLIEVMRQAHFVSDNYFTNNIFEVTIALTAAITLLSFLSLVDRFKKMKKTAQLEKEQLITEQNILLERKVEERTRDLEIEKKKSDELLKKSDELLLNILPKETAEELRQYGRSRAKTYGMVTVMFTDFKDFSEVSEKVSPELLVAEIDYCFSTFDNIIQKYSVEKIKTVGDAYLCVGGMPILTFDHAEDTVKAAIEIRNFMLERKQEKENKRQIPFEIRIGIHTGPVVAGIVGQKKFAYDIWGDTVNIAARMEQHSEAGKINISGATFQLVKDKFHLTHRGKIEAKNKGEIDMYFAETYSS